MANLRKAIQEKDHSLKGTKIIVAGSRTFTNYELLESTLDKLTAKFSDVVILQGGAEGADRLADKWCFRKKVPMQVFHADWKRHKKLAGPIRNTEMVKHASHLILFWDGISPGSRDVLNKARKHGLKIKIIRFDRIKRRKK